MMDAPKISIMNPLEERILYKFRNSLLLAEALTHPSISLERKSFPFDNQRLEFLGDAVIQVSVTEHLFRMFPDFGEGQLTKLRTRIVSRPALRERAAAIDLGSFIMMGRGEEANGGRERASTLADAFESLVGAIYLDGGFDAARIFILRQMDSVFTEIANQPEEINPKGYLQEILQAIQPTAPDYRIISQTGPEHSKMFICCVVWNGIELGQGQGCSKKEAQVAAAQVALGDRLWESVGTKPAPRKKKKKVKSSTNFHFKPLASPQGFCFWSRTPSLSSMPMAPCVSQKPFPAPAPWHRCCSQPPRPGLL
jgi:ribonuclease-3